MNRILSLRTVATQILIRVENDRAYPQILIDGFFKRHRTRDARDLAFVREMVMGVLRRRSRLDWALERHSTTPIVKLDVPTRNALRVGAYQLLYMDRIPASAAVNETVAAAKAVHPRSSGVVNAVLRRLAGESPMVPWPGTETPWTERMAVLTAHPTALVERARRQWGEERAARWLESNNALPPLTLRVNAGRLSRAALLEALHGAGMEAIPTPVSPEGILIFHTGGGRLDFEAGLYYAQDEAAQQVARLLEVAPGMEVLEIGAAPGGKTGQLLDRLDGKGTVTAVDRHEGRMGRMKTNLEGRSAANLRCFTRDFARSTDFLGDALFDRILIDAPCSGLGTLRRHPEKKWTWEDSALPSLSDVQRRLLANAAARLKPGGRMVYATCTVTDEENGERIGEFLANRPDFRREPFGPDSLPESWTDPDGAMASWRPLLEASADPERAPDGFYAAALMRER